MPVGAQEESRTERGHVTLTPSEKNALRLVSTVDQKDESTLLRDFTVADILERADDIRRKLEEVA
jgi:hypothetical protein